MAFSAATVMERASILLQDIGGVRWPATELAKWIEDGQREICLHKPSVLSDIVEIALVAGTEQSVPTTAHHLIRIMGNLTASADPGPKAHGPAIQMMEEGLLDHVVPDWRSTAIYPADSVVVHAFHDASLPDKFHVFPANDGNGLIEAVVGLLPNPVAVPASDPELVESWTHTCQIPDILMNALVDYVCFRSCAKDSDNPAMGQRAIVHYQAYANAIGIKSNMEAAMRPDTKAQS